MNIVERLVEMQDKEVKRRNDAVEYIIDLEELLSPIFLEIEGEEVITPQNHEIETEAIWIPTWDKERDKYNYNNSVLYFRYGVAYLSEYEEENIGFYVEYHEGVKKGGTELIEIKGSIFWEQIKVITDWLINYLPGYIKNKDESRDKRLVQLENALNTLNDSGFREL